MSNPDKTASAATAVTDAVKAVRIYAEALRGSYASRYDTAIELDRVADHLEASLSSSARADAQAVAWQHRACINGLWGSWLDLNAPIDVFRKRYAFNLDNGTMEIRSTFASSSSELEELRREVERVREVWEECEAHNKELRAENEALQERLKLAEVSAASPLLPAAVKVALEEYEGYDKGGGVDDTLMAARLLAKAIRASTIISSLKEGTPDGQV